MPGHWLLARLGKRVLRPGGRELTDELLAALDISNRDDVVELAPGLGSTTRLVLDRNPSSYIGVDRDEASAELVSQFARGLDRRVVNASASDTGLPDASADVVFGEAYLTMQPAGQKAKILAELARVARPGARLGIHEVAFAPDDIEPDEADRIAAALRSSIKVNVTPLPLAGWRLALDDAGFDVERVFTNPLHLLEPRRLVADEGVAGAVRFASRVARDRAARARVLSMRRAMHDNAEHLQACAIVAVRRTS